MPIAAKYPGVTSRRSARGSLPGATGGSPSTTKLPLFWPPPTTLWDTARDLIGDGSLLTDVRVSLGRILVGFALGAIPAVAFGLAMGLFWPVRVFLMPLAAAVYAIPKIALVPLVFWVVGLYGWIVNLRP